MLKPIIKYTTCESGDWAILDINYGENFHREGHSMVVYDWIKLLRALGYKVECECLTDEEMELRCNGGVWYSTSEKMPNVGDHVYAYDGYDTYEITVTGVPESSWSTNVIKWRYAE